MRRAEVFANGVKAGILEERDDKTFLFRYDDVYYADPSKNMISLTMPKNQQEYESPCLFPFFFNLIAEGANLRLQSKYLKIDDQDYFGLLCATACYDAIGAITVRLIETA